MVWPNQGQVLGNQSSPVAQPTCSCKPETRKRISLRAPTHRRGTPLREKWYYAHVVRHRQFLLLVREMDQSKRQSLSFLSFVAFIFVAAAPGNSDATGARYSNSWAVEVRGGSAAADALAHKHGFVNLGQVNLHS